MDNQQPKPIRDVLRHNAEIAMSHAVASGDAQRIALVKEWIKKLEEEPAASGY